MKKLLALFLLITVGSHLLGQEMATIKGTIVDQLGRTVPDANITVRGTAYGTTSDEAGKYEFKVPANETLRLRFSNIQYQTRLFRLELEPNQIKVLNIEFDLRTLGPIVISDRQKRTMEDLFVIVDGEKIPSTSGNFEDIVKTAGLGVSSANELSSGYNVRGGNFEENLIYVNDIEIYRPFLARSGQQEGLSFINSALVDQISFSAGGFDAKYGDKLSSVLDVTYRKPRENKGSFSASLLGVNGHFEGLSKNQLWTHTTGARYRTNRYLLGALDTKGDYRPTFADIQTYVTYTPNDKWEHSFLGNYALNKYLVVPENRETSFGSINQALKFTVFFDGQEVTQYQTFTGAFTSAFTPNDSTTLKFIGSAFRTLQDENFDVEGQYLLDELERDPGSDDFGDVAFNIGVGGFLRHARNQLDATVLTLQHKGERRNKKRKLLWGVKAQHDIINDKLKEWNVLDSAGYLAPRDEDSVGYVDSSAQPYQFLNVNDLLIAENNVNTFRFSAYIQQSWNLMEIIDKKFTKTKVLDDTTYQVDTTIQTSKGFNINAGIRGNYWTFNNEFVISPRASIEYRPSWLYLNKKGQIKKHNISFRFASGVYQQPPFYREYRRFDGSINDNIQAQRSIHFVLGGDYIFKMWDKDFKFTSETYYKILDRVIPYDIDNVRIRYYAENNAKAFSRGIDFKINGRFIADLESWATLSIMQTKIDIANDQFFAYVNTNGETIIPGITANDTIADSLTYFPGYLPRPTDQRISFGLFFQDKMPKVWNSKNTKWDTFKVNMNFIFATGFPYLSKDILTNPVYEENKFIPRTPRYIRADIGFVKDFISKEYPSKKKFWKQFEELSLSLEIFNFLGIDNTVSYNFIRATNGQKYAIPNRLTARRFNLKLIGKF